MKPIRKIFIPTAPPTSPKGRLTNPPINEGSIVIVIDD
jgi:hypothetical protein